MLKRRVVISLLLKDGVLNRSKQFDGGSYRYTIAFVGNEAADECLVLDITRYGAAIPLVAARQSFVATAVGYAATCFSPLTVGGGIRTLSDVAYCFREIGADKIVLGTIAHEHPEFIGEVARKYGRQAVVVAVDVDAAGRVVSHQGSRVTDVPLEAYARAAVAAGAGELLVSSIDRDGSLRGYDLDALRRVIAVVDVPVVIAGGCAGYQSMLEAFEAGADGAASSNIFHISESALATFKRELVRRGASVRP